MAYTKPRSRIVRSIDWPQSLKQVLINGGLSYTCSQSNTDGSTEPSELDWLQVYDMTH